MGQIIKSFCVCACVSVHLWTLTVTFIRRFSPNWTQTCKPPKVRTSSLGVNIALPLPLFPLKTSNFGGVNRRFQAKLAESKNVHIIKTTASIPTTFCTVIKTTKCPSSLAGCMIEDVLISGPARVYCTLGRIFVGPGRILGNTQLNRK